MPTTDQQQTFTADVNIAGINPYVDVPGPVVDALGGGPKAAVLVKVARIDPTTDDVPATPANERLAKDAARLKAIGRLAPGGWFRPTLVPLRSHPTRLYLDTWMRETAGVTVGDRARVTLQRDLASRELLVPAALDDGLRSSPPAKAAWDALAPSRRGEILTYLNFLRTPAALERNVRKVIADLLAQEARE
jgi:hypothetical protein